MNLIEQQIYAQSLVAEHFVDKVDKVGKPYLYHLHKVATMSFYMGWKFAAKREQREDFAMKCFIAGLLHDTLEDTEVTHNELAEHFDKDVVDAVIMLTRPNFEPYNMYLKYILSVGERNPIMILVKYCDLCHNGDITRYPLEERTKEVRKRCKKYRKRAHIFAKKILEMMNK